MKPRPNAMEINDNLSQHFLRPIQIDANKCRKIHFNSWSLKLFFGWHGASVARHPWLYIIFSIILTGCCGIGLINLTKETNGIKLWVPSNSASRLNSDWLWNNYPPDIRYNNALFLAEDVLVPDVIQYMYKLHKKIESIRIENGISWQGLCQRIPVVGLPPIKNILLNIFKNWFRRKRFAQEITNETESFFDDWDTNDDDTENLVDTTVDASVTYYPDPYCSIIKQMKTVCLEKSILNLWSNKNSLFDEETDANIKALTKQKIIEVINSGKQINNISKLLGQKTFDSNGNIVSAKATMIIWFGLMNVSRALSNPVPGRDESIDKDTFEFEKAMIDAILNFSMTLPDSIDAIYPFAGRSFGDIASMTILGDTKFLILGYGLLFFYVVIMLGNFNCVEQRIHLTAIGLISIIMGLIISYGICSAFGLFIGPMHNLIPFLLLGIGVDDMFVIVQCWKNFNQKEEKFRRTKTYIEERMRRTMEKAGTTITITSLTDIIVFGIGSTTVLPALQSFCIYTSIGILAIFWLQCMFFLPCMVLDQRRIEARRNGVVPCFIHKRQTDQQNKLNQSYFFNYLGKLLTLFYIKIFIMGITITLGSFGIWGNLLLEQKFEPSWFLPPDSYIFKWIEAQNQYFPKGRYRISIFLYNIDYHQDFNKIHTMFKVLYNQSDIIDNLDAWPLKYAKYFAKNFAVNTSHKSKLNLFSEKSFVQFLFSRAGSKYRSQFKFENKPICGQDTLPKLLLSSSTFTHHHFNKSFDRINAMNRVKKILASVKLTRNHSKIFALSKVYANWETDEIIAHELYRNLGIALLCIFVSTLVLLAKLLPSILVLLSVVLTLLNVGGSMYFWGLTIDIISCVLLVIAIGLCVDYSVHLTHAYVTTNGCQNSNERMKQSLNDIGPAILNGGISTFLAFIPLINSQSYVFSTFFKIFFLVVLFGLYHGLLFLPVILTMCDKFLCKNSLKDEEDVMEENPEHQRKNSKIMTTELENISINYNCHSD